MIVMVRVLEHDDGCWYPRYEYRHPWCFDEGEHVESWDCHPMQPNRYDFSSNEDYEQALTEQFSRGRCGQRLTNLGPRSGDGAGTAPGAGDVHGAGNGF